MSKKKKSKKAITYKSDNQKKTSRKKVVFLAIFSFIVLASIIAATLFFFNTTGNNLTRTGSDNKTTAESFVISEQSTGNFKITDVVITRVTEASITAKWKTSMPSTSELHVSDEAGFTRSNWPDDNLVREHEATIDNLTPSTLYKLQILSKNASGSKVVVDIEKPYQTLYVRTKIGIFVGDRSPDFLLKSTTGESIVSQNYSSKWVMLVFWKLICNACKEELPFINAFYKNMNNKNFALLTINTKEQKEIVENYIKGQKFSFPVLLDIDGAVTEKYAIATFPTTLLIDTNGIVSRIKEGSFKSENEISEFVRSGIPGY